MLFIPLFIFLFFIFSSRIILQTQLSTYLIKLRWIGISFRKTYIMSLSLGTPHIHDHGNLHIHVHQYLVPHHFNITCWGNKYFIELPLIINIIYRDILWLKRSKSSNYVLNYVILITYFSYHYLMYDFTHVHAQHTLFITLILIHSLVFFSFFLFFG